MKILSKDGEADKSTRDTLDWEALEVDSESITLRMLFDDYERISKFEEQNDMIYITLNLARFKTAEGLFIPNLSLYSSELPL